MQHTSRWQTVEQTTDAMALHHGREGSVGALFGLFADGSLGRKHLEFTCPSICDTTFIQFIWNESPVENHPFAFHSCNLDT